MKPKTVHDAINEGWQVFQFNFTDGSSERIASLITNGTTSFTLTYLLEKDILEEPIEDDWPNFSYEQFFSRKIKGLIEDVTKEYTSI